jgi:3-hydroxyisobutyrate dehydrogenase-like beta-hydroxyacid dehydrogenase
MTSVGVIGLGLMGSAIAGRLLDAEFAVYGYTRGTAARDALAARGGTPCASAAEVASHCSVVMLSLPDGATSQSVCEAPEGLIEGGDTETLVVDTTTTSPEEAEGLAAALRVAGIGFLDAGLSGSSNAVAHGAVLALVGGRADDFTRASPALQTFCTKLVHVGDAGNGMRAKLVVNYVHAINRLALAEGLVLTEMMGMDLEQMLDILGSSAASSRAIDTWGQQMVHARHYPPLSRVRTSMKDAELISELARAHQAPTPAWTQFVEVLRSAVSGGLGDADNSAIVEVLRRRAGRGRLPESPEAEPGRSTSS